MGTNNLKRLELGVFSKRQPLIKFEGVSAKLIPHKSS